MQSGGAHCSTYGGCMSLACMRVCGRPGTCPCSTASSRSPLLPPSATRKACAGARVPPAPGCVSCMQSGGAHGPFGWGRSHSPCLAVVHGHLHGLHGAPACVLTWVVACAWVCVVLGACAWGWGPVPSMACAHVQHGGWRIAVSQLPPLLPRCPLAVPFRIGFGASVDRLLSLRRWLHGGDGCMATRLLLHTWAAA
jgi:hypothetical protein